MTPASKCGNAPTPSGLVARRRLLAATPREILATYEVLRDELRRRNVVRTNDAPAGQYAEWLAHRALGGMLEANSVKSHDLVTRDGRKIQVKSRVLRSPSKASERQLSPFRSFEFTEALVILFDREYDVIRGTLLPMSVIRRNATESGHVNGRIFTARDALLDLGTDITKRLRRVNQ